MRELFDALRWHDRNERTALWWAAALGMFGVVTGYLVFAAVRHELHHHRLHMFLAAVLVAAVVSYGWERLNELIKHGHLDEDASAPVLIRAIGTFLVVLLLELFISAWGKGVEELKAFLGGLVELIVRGAAEEPPWLALIAVSVVWVVLGALMSWLLVVVILRMAPARASLEDAAGRDDRVAFWVSSGLVGVAVGVAVAVVLLGLVLGFRFYRALGSMVFDHAYWRASLDNLAATGPTMASLTTPLLWVDDGLWRQPWLRMPTAVVVGGIVLVWLWKRAFGLVLTVIVWSIFFPALIDDYRTLWNLLTRSALLWLVPGFALGLGLPLLRGPKSRDWSIIAAAAGLLLAGLAVAQAAGEWKLIAAAIAAFGLAALLVIFRGSKFRDAFIMLLAPVNGLAIFALAMIPATALGVANDFVFMTDRPGIGLDHLSRAELTRLAGADSLDRAIQAHPDLRQAVPGRLADVYERLEDLAKFTDRLYARADELTVITDKLTRQRMTPVPAPAVADLGTGGLSDVLLRRTVWLDRAAGSVKRLRERTRLQIRGESINRGLDHAEWAAPTFLNASFGGAIGYMVTLALLAGWKIKDQDGPHRGAGEAAAHSER
ncbi:MAG TPA: hypothetical protein VFR53_10000 [Methylomirabilota bacterium]|nr:hypothetical protein [Methylomirabilota bacterium]